MRKRLLDCHLVTALVAVASFVFLAAGCLAQQQHQPSSSQQDSLRRFLQNYDGSSTDEGRKETRYLSAFVDLKDDGVQEVIVYFVSNKWCGSGGCTALILAPEGSSYKVVTKITVTRLPIRVLATKSNGWHDIAIPVHGGGIVHAYEANLSFDGEKYPSNPTVPPAKPLIGNVPGTVVISDATEGKSLY